jgi:hypothetical protein
MFRLVEGGDFGLDSANVGLCYVSFLPKAEGDVGIFRGPAIEEEGFLDVGVDCIKDAAQQIGWKGPEYWKPLEVSYEELKKQCKNLEQRLAKAEKALGLVKEIKKSK